ncbi:MAG: hypothetical protein EPN40_12245 [Rhodanobacteraceae bacterium]|nr:MAG: hypothetical protein EPN40_12245 [Rhodanobacteraceae bacterium]
MSKAPLPPGSDCLRARRYLLLRERGPAAVTAETIEIDAHLRGCVTCRAYADEMLAWRRLGARLRDGHSAPEAMRQRWFRNLALARTQWLEEAPNHARRRTRRQAILWAVTGLALLAAVVAWVGPFRFPVGSVDPGSLVAEDHWREVHQQSVQSSDPAEIRRWLQQRLALPVRVILIPGATLEGARLCLLRGRLGAVIRYRVSGAPVSYYVMPAIEGNAGEARDRNAIQQEAAQGYNVVLWYERGLLHALVGDLPRTQLLRLAADCRQRGRLTSATFSQAG